MRVVHGSAALFLCRASAAKFEFQIFHCGPAAGASVCVAIYPGFTSEVNLSASPNQRPGCSRPSHPSETTVCVAQQVDFQASSLLERVWQHLRFQKFSMSANTRLSCIDRLKAHHTWHPILLMAVEGLKNKHADYLQAEHLTIARPAIWPYRICLEGSIHQSAAAGHQMFLRIQTLYALGLMSMTSSLIAYTGQLRLLPFSA